MRAEEEQQWKTYLYCPASGPRSASIGGGLASVPPCDLAAKVVREAVSRSGVDPAEVGHVVFGNVLHTEKRDMYLSRVAAVNGGLEVGTPALTVNRLCGSGLQAIVSASQAIMLGDCEVAVAGGAEVDEPRPVLAARHALGRSGWATVPSLDSMTGALSDPFDGCHMGVTAENVAADFHVSRADQDALAAESHRRAAAAIKRQATSRSRSSRSRSRASGVKTTIVDTDEHVRLRGQPRGHGQAAARVRQGRHGHRGQRVRRQRRRRGGGARVGVVRQRSNGFSPLGKLIGYAHAGVEPRIMGIGPVPAVRSLLDRTGMKIEDIDVFEVNEAFAAQALAVVRELGLPPERTNPNGSGISLGHPVGATGAILAVKSHYELKRTGGRYALVTMCIGGGQGIAAIFERV